MASSEIAFGLGVTVLAGAAFYVVKSVFNMSTILQNRYLELVPNTIIDDAQVIVFQDAKTYSTAKTILPSVNERTGMEFSYSFFLSVDQNTFNNGEEVLYSVFYKGYDNNPWPLLSPGVFIMGNNNTMRVIMSSLKEPYNYVDVENIPINKWFHVVLNYQNSALEVFINGKIVKKLYFNNALPYNNFQNINIFNKKTLTVNIPTGRNIRFQGSINGKISRLIYTRYALSVSEIQSLYKKGPSSIITTATPSVETSYLSDSWWVNQ
jgi:hypothetical protein